MKPHRHADLIHAWAEGDEIEERYATDAENTKWGHWKQFDGTWMDGDDWQYRIKPAKSELEEILESAIRQVRGRYLTEEEENLVDILKSYKDNRFKCNGFCGEYECKEHQDICKRLHKDNYLDPCGNRCYWPKE